MAKLIIIDGHRIPDNKIRAVLRSFQNLYNKDEEQRETARRFQAAAKNNSFYSLYDRERMFLRQSGFSDKGFDEETRVIVKNIVIEGDRIMLPGFNQSPLKKGPAPEIK